jgi:hypothetical protein
VRILAPPRGSGDFFHDRSFLLAFDGRSHSQLDRGRTGVGTQQFRAADDHRKPLVFFGNVFRHLPL